MKNDSKPAKSHDERRKNRRAEGGNPWHVTHVGARFDMPPASAHVAFMSTEEMARNGAYQGEYQSRSQADEIDDEIHRTSLVGCDHSKSANTPSSKTERRSAGSRQFSIKSIQQLERQSDPFSQPILIGVWFFIHCATDSRPVAGNHLQSSGAIVGRPENISRHEPWLVWSSALRRLE